MDLYSLVLKNTLLKWSFVLRYHISGKISGLLSGSQIKKKKSWQIFAVLCFTSI